MGLKENGDHAPASIASSISSVLHRQFTTGLLPTAPKPVPAIAEFLPPGQPATVYPWGLNDNRLTCSNTWSPVSGLFEKG